MRLVELDFECEKVSLERLQSLPVVVKYWLDWCLPSNDDSPPHTSHLNFRKFRENLNQAIQRSNQTLSK